MKKTLLVPVDFTPVSHEALLFACELSKNHETEIVAVHLLDDKIAGQFNAGKNPALKKMAERMYEEIMVKTKKDLDNFLSGLQEIYGNIIHPLIAHGTIYEAFNDVASKYDSSLIIMGTHGIVGMQNVFGSIAYKVVVRTPYPFLIVQEKAFKPINTIYFVFKDVNQMVNNADVINTFTGYFPAKYIFNILSGDNVLSTVIPPSLNEISDRITLVQEPLLSKNAIDCAYAAGADAIGLCIDEMENINGETYGITQEKILANKYKLPVLCLPVKASL